MIFAEIMLASTMNAVFVAFFPLLTLPFRTVPRQRFLLFVANSRFLQRNAPRRLCLTPFDRLLWIWLARCWSSWRSSLQIVQPTTVLRWQRVGSTRIHGEFARAGNRRRAIDGAKYRQPRRKPPSQVWRTFLWNHAGQMGSIHFFTLPTPIFRVLFVFAVCLRCPVAWSTACGAPQVTELPTQGWTMQQMRRAFPWDQVSTWGAIAMRSKVKTFPTMARL